jgi:hypothetical protein
MRQFFRNFGEVRKMIRRGKPSEPVIRLCPVCFNKTLVIQPSFLAFLAPTTYACSTCQYKGPIFAEVPLEDYAKLKDSGEI